MSTSGSYSERLPCGGSLHVSKDSWSIGYYFSGPDARYKGSHFSIKGQQVDDYIEAIVENWEKYKQLQQVAPTEGTFTKTGKLEMQISVGGYRPGVCIGKFYLPISNEIEMEKYISSYRYAIKRASDIQVFLSNMD